MQIMRFIMLRRLHEPWRKCDCPIVFSLFFLLGLLALQPQDAQLPQSYLTSLPSVVGRLEVALAGLAKDSTAYNAQAGTARCFSYVLTALIITPAALRAYFYAQANNTLP
jgi:hypothetical protein